LPRRCGGADGASPLPPAFEQGRELAVSHEQAGDAGAGTSGGPAGVTRASQSLQRKATCRLIGLHADAAWTTPIRIDIGGANEAMDFYPKQQMRLLPDADGVFVIDLPGWVDQCVNQFWVIVRAHDPFYVELGAEDYAASFAASSFRRNGGMEFEVRPCAVLTGTVRTEAGDPVPAVAVHALSLVGQRPIGSWKPMAFSGGEGQFTLQVPMHADVMVVAIPMNLTVMNAMPLTGANRGVAGSVRLRRELLAASTRCSAAFGVRSDIGVLTVHAASVVRTQVLVNGEPVSRAEVEYPRRAVGRARW
jgi:hypothetical protein